MVVNKIIGIPVKVTGGLLVFFGLIAVFGLSQLTDRTWFLINIVVGPASVYLGFKLLSLNL